MPNRTSVDRRSPFRLLAYVLIGVLVVVIAVTGTLLVQREQRASQQIATAEPSAPIPRMSNRLAPITLPPNPNVLIFGDSYTQGFGAVPETEGWAYKMGERMGWNVTVEGVTGSGYLNPGPSAGGRGGTYSERLNKLPAPGPFDLVILQGGSNDQKMLVDEAGAPTDLNLVRQAINDAYMAAKGRYPNAQVVVLGPVSVATGSNAAKRTIDSLLSEFAASNGLFYISPVSQGWFKTDEQATLVDAATGHPSNLGYIRVADRVEANMRDTVLASAVN